MAAMIKVTVAIEDDPVGPLDNSLSFSVTSLDDSPTKAEVVEKAARYAKLVAYGVLRLREIELRAQEAESSA